MVFVNEQIPPEKWQEFEYRRRTVDYERDACLIYRDAFDYGKVKRFDFFYNGRIFQVDAELAYDTKRRTLIYSVCSISLKSGNNLSKNEKIELLKLTKEALVKRGMTGDPTREDNTEVSLSSFLIKSMGIQEDELY